MRDKAVEKPEDKKPEPQGTKTKVEVTVRIKRKDGTIEYL